MGGPELPGRLSRFSRGWRELGKPRRTGAGSESGSDVDTARAVSRLAELGEEVRRIDRLAALGDLLAEIVHEVRNPLVSIKTFLQLLPERADDPEFTEEFRSVVMEEVGRMERLLDSLVQHARPASDASARPCAQPRVTLDSVVGLLRHRALDRSVQLAAEGDPVLPAVALDEDSLRQVLINLALNAIEATPPGGAVRMGGVGRADRVALWIDDEGTGVPPEHRERVFEPFFSTRADRPGGLGLAISQRIVSDAGGRIAVEDAPGGGARFHFRLPRAPSPS
ncbi:MAG: ATP-binding protein [Proteobacteria bacterium]|nr:ATP-binding protein [Pseudomonadota bacterium]